MWEAFRLYTRYFEYRQVNRNLFKKFTASEADLKPALLDGFPGVLPQVSSTGLLTSFLGIIQKPPLGEKSFSVHQVAKEKPVGRAGFFFFHFQLTRITIRKKTFKKM